MKTEENKRAINKVDFIEMKNFNNYLKKYFNSIDYTDKNGNFINYYNFINDLDSFNDSFMKDVIKCYFEYIDECF